MDENKMKEIVVGVQQAMMKCAMVAVEKTEEELAELAAIATILVMFADMDDQLREDYMKFSGIPIEGSKLDQVGDILMSQGIDVMTMSRVG